MVISVFPQGGGFNAYREARRGRLQDESMRTEMDLRNQQREAYNQMLGGIQDPQRRAAVAAGGVDRGPVIREGQREQDAQRLQAEIEARQRFLQEEGPRYRNWRLENPDADESEFARGARIRAQSMGIELQLDEEGRPSMLMERIRPFAQGVQPEGSQSRGTEFERELQALVDTGQITPERARELRIANLETEAGVRSRPGSGLDLAGVVEAALGGRGQQQQLGREVDTAREGMDAARDALFTVSDLRQTLSETGPGSIGMIATVRRAGEGLSSQLEALASYPGGDRIVEIGRRAGMDPNLEDEARELFFDPNLSAVDYLANSLAYSIARSREPGGRLAKEDVANVRSSLGLGSLGSDAQLEAALQRVEREMSRNYGLHSERYARLMGTEVPPAPDASGAPAPAAGTAPPPPTAPIEDLVGFYAAEEG